MVSKNYTVTLPLVIIAIVLNIFGINQMTFGQNNPNQIIVNNNSDQTITPSNYYANSTVNDNLSSNDPTGWLNISGLWTLNERGLHGGSDSRGKVQLNNILLHQATNDSIKSLSTSFKVHDLNMMVPNYVAIVHSFLDPNNYKYAGINLFNDGIYGIFYNVTNGVLTSYPQWPGIKTDLNWKPGTFYNMSLVNSDSTLDLIVNGTTYSSIPTGDNILSEGKVGLDYGRIKSLDFLNFATESTDSPLKEIHTTQDSLTILLDGKTLPEGDYIHLYDSSPYKIMSGHVAINLPCDDDNSTDVNILMGQAPDLKPANLEFVGPLSTPGEFCLYHVNVASDETTPITDIAIQNNSTDDIEFPTTSSVLVSLNEISGP